MTPTLIYIKDRQRRLQMVNPATTRLLGKSEAELIGKTEVDYLRPEEAEQIAENDCRVMDSGQVIMFWLLCRKETAYFFRLKRPIGMNRAILSD